MKQFSTDPQALLVSCALGITLKNQAATKVGLEKLYSLREKQQSNLGSEFDFRLSLLESMSHLIRGDTKNAFRILQKATMMYPFEQRNWLRLSKFVQVFFYYIHKLIIRITILMNHLQDNTKVFLQNCTLLSKALWIPLSLVRENSLTSINYCMLDQKETST